MRIIIFSDIHGNQYALDAFFSVVRNEKYDMLIFCGDIFGYYYGQDMIINRLKEEKNMYWVKGNHDKFALEIYDGILSPDIYIEKYGHSYYDIKNKVSKENIEFVRKLPEKIEVYIEGKKIGIFHGTPEENLEGRLYPDNEIANINLYNKYDYVILGHTHFKMIKKCGGTVIINPGSLGQQRDGKGFGYAELVLPEGDIKFHNIEYSFYKLCEEIQYNDKDLSKLIDILYRKY